jgi:carboxyl-terminal processing protease
LQSSQCTGSRPGCPAGRPFSPRLRLCQVILGLLLLLATTALLAADKPLSRLKGDLKALRARAEQHERLGEWDKACDAYYLLLRANRNRPEIKERFLHCLRRYYQVYRQKDPSYRKEVLTLGYPQALKIYRYVVKRLADGALERQTASPTRLFRKGLDELLFALADPTFCHYNLPSARPTDVQAFRQALKANWGGKAVKTPQHAAKMVRDVAMECFNTLNLNATTAVMEFTCGACYAVDDYTTYLTPAQLRDLCDSLKGETVGIGISLTPKNGKLMIDEVFVGSPAAKVSPTLERGDLLLRVDGRPVSQLPVETALSLLQGDAGSKVEIEVYSTSLGAPRPPMTLVRQAYFVPSVPAPRQYLNKRDPIGYVKISAFQQTTAQELDVAIAELNRVGMKALVLDLRNNPGGQVEAAVESARRFLREGVIVRTEYPDSRLNTVDHARNPGAMTLPLVVLIDGDTASAAEILAGALKDNRRATLIGQTTFGKGCIQGLLRLETNPGEVFPGGVRLTVARFLSPLREPYTGRGVTPHHVVDRTATPESFVQDNDEQLNEALEEAQRLIDKTS